MKLGIISGSRAESGILSNLVKCINTSSEISTHIFFTGVHPIFFDKTYTDYLYNCPHTKVKTDVSAMKNIKINNILSSLKQSIDKFSKLRSFKDIDMLILFGDRPELIGPAIVARMNDIPISHFHGGEITEGAIDDWIRHMLTKLSNVHFVANKQYGSRVKKMGENPKNIHNIGSIALDRITELEKKSINNKKLDTFIKKHKNKYILFTMHPETASSLSVQEQVQSIFNYLKQTNIPIILTSSNNDIGGAYINNEVNKIVNEKEDVFFQDNLGQHNYLFCVKNSLCVIGNSSSGLVEVPALSKPFINIGTRQDGREFADCIISINNKFHLQKLNKIIKGIERGEIRFKYKNLPYGLSGASQKVLEILNSTDLSLLSKKVYFDAI